SPDPSTHPRRGRPPRRTRTVPSVPSAAPSAAGAGFRQQVQMSRERFEAFHVVYGNEIVDERERGAHPASERLVPPRPRQPIGPDEPGDNAPQTPPPPRA